MKTFVKVGIYMLAAPCMIVGVIIAIAYLGIMVGFVATLSKIAAE